MNEVKLGILEAVEKASDVRFQSEDLKASPVADYGCPVGFKLAGKLRRKPDEIASEIAKKIKAGGYIKEVSSAGGYVNFTLDCREVAKHLLTKKDKQRKRKEKVILEHTSVNPTGPVHVGRIRNTIIGDSLRRILLYAGYDVVTHYYVNDVGKQVAIIAAGLEDKLEPDPQLMEKYDKYANRDDYKVFFTYVSANKLFEEDTGFQERVQSMIRAAESGDKKALKTITSAAQAGLKGQLATFDRLGAKFDVFDYESEFLTDGSVDEVMKAVRRSGDYVKDEIGEGLDLKRYGIEKRGGMTVLARTDATSVYLGRDIAYHLRKVKLGDRIINVLGEDHKMEFQELKTILTEVFGVKKQLEVVHFSFVNFEGAKFSTRRGEIAAADELLDEAVAKARAEVERRQLGDEKTAQQIGIGAVKFHIVKTTPNKQITFRWADALNFEGESAPYIQYAHARSCRILEKSGLRLDAIKKVDYDVTQDEEKALIKKLLEFDEALEESARQLRPDVIAAYLLELTAEYGRFYMKCPVLDAQEPVRNRRLLLVKKLADTIKTGLDLLGIEAPERM